MSGSTCLRRGDSTNSASYSRAPLGNDPDIGSRSGGFFVESENFNRGNVNKDLSTYGTEIGVLVNGGESPNWVEYDLDIPATGRYQLESRLAAASSRPCALSINGQVVKADFAKQVTGSWFPDTQTWFVEGFYRLRAGTNVLRIEQPNYFPHMDKLLLVHMPQQADQPATLDVLTEDGYEHLPDLVKQWSDYLRRLRDDEEDSPFSVWLSATRNADADEVARLVQHFQQRSAEFVSAETTENVQSADSADADDDALRRVLYDKEGPFKVPAKFETYYEANEIELLTTLRKQRKVLVDSLPQFPHSMAVSDGPVEDLPVHVLGSHLTLGDTVSRGFPTVLQAGEATAIGGESSGRLEMAHWLTAREHPLTARVIVNRLWLWHFGAGLVRSPDNFGRLGERATHPKLLDWLAARLVTSEWSLKQMHRDLMLSSTYQMSTAFNERAMAIDPENRLVWRFNRRRLEAEAIRDAFLAVSGRLDQQLGGSLLPTANRAYVTSTANVDTVTYRTNRRALYLPVVRSAVYDMFQAFDFADPSMLSGQRQTTTVAPQALFMMNSQFVSEQTAALADVLLTTNELDDAGRIHVLYDRAFTRPPAQHEVIRALDFVENYAELSAARDDAPGDARRTAWQSLCRAVLATNEFIYLE